MSNFRVPEYLLRQQVEVPVAPTHLCACVTDRPGEPVGVYIGDPSCQECRGIGVVTAPGIPRAFDPIPLDHPSRFHEQWVEGMPHPENCGICSGRRPA